jgi:hypothetical protein
MIAVNSTPDNVGRINALPFGKFELVKDRAEYIEVLRRGDINTLNTLYETFCISCVESMALGQPIVAPNGLTFAEITGRNETGYPYLFKGVREQKEFLRTLIERPAKRREWGEKVSKFVRREFNDDLWATNWIDLIERTCGPETSFQPNTGDDGQELVASKLSKHSGCTIRELSAKIRCVRYKGRAIFGSQSLSMAKLARLVRMVGGTVEFRFGKQKCYAPGQRS